MLTEEILQHAKQKEWDVLVKKEQERRVLMGEFFHKNPGDHEMQQIEDTVRHMIYLDEKTVSLAESGKMNVLKKMRNISTAKNAIDAYVNSSS